RDGLLPVRPTAPARSSSAREFPACPKSARSPRGRGPRRTPAQGSRRPTASQANGASWQVARILIAKPVPTFAEYAHLARSGVLAQGQLPHRLAVDAGRQRRGPVIGGTAVPAALLCGIEA